MPLTNTAEIDRLWTDRDVAVYAQVSPRTIRRWRLDGRIPAIRLFGIGAYRYKPDEVRAAILCETPLRNASESVPRRQEEPG